MPSLEFTSDLVSVFFLCPCVWWPAPKSPWYTCPCAVRPTLFQGWAVPSQHMADGWSLVIQSCSFILGAKSLLGHPVWGMRAERGTHGRDLEPSASSCGRGFGAGDPGPETHSKPPPDSWLQERWLFSAADFWVFYYAARDNYYLEQITLIFEW